MVKVEIDGRRVGPDEPVFVIAEAGVNHNGDPAMATQLVDAAADAGADAVKFQTFDPALVAAADAPKATYQRREGPTGTQRTMLERLALPRAIHQELQVRARSRGLVFLSTPFDEPSAEMLVGIGVPALKVASGEVTNLPFLRSLARFGLPMLISTGMCTLEEVAAALASIGDTPRALFHCVSSYPADPQDANLRAMGTLRQAFRVPVGWSDHTPGIDIAIGAAALGADIIEKHLTLDRSLPGPDHKASLEPNEFAALVRSVRAVQKALGSGEKRPTAAEAEIARIARRSLYWRSSLSEGETIRPEHLIALRPAGGLAPGQADEITGRKVNRPVIAGTAVTEADLAK